MEMMEEKYDVTVIVPVYNVEKYIRRCLQSVLEQESDGLSIECLLIDDCSPDDSIAIVCEPPKEPEYEEQIELIEKEVKPYRVTMRLNNMILMPQKEPWNKNA